MEVARITTVVDVDLGKSESAIARVKTATDNLRKTTEQATQATASLGRAGTTAGVGMASLTRTTNEARASVTSLGAGMRDLTTGMLGSNLAAVTLGTTIGAVLTQAVMRVAQSIVQSVDAFARLRNELIETQRIGQNAGAAFDAIQVAAVGSRKTITELTASYKTLAGQIDMTLVGTEKFNQVFINYQQALGKLQAPTLGSEFSRLADKLSGLFSGNNVRNITSELDVSYKLIDIEEKRNVLQYQIAELRKQGLFNLSEESRKTRELAQANLDKKALLERQADIIKLQNAAYDTAITTILPAIRDELDHQVSIGGKLRQEQELLNQLRSVELKFREQGVTLGEKERAEIAAKLRDAQAASQITGIRDSLMSGAGLEAQQYTERTDALRRFYQGRQDLAVEFNSLMDAENYRHQFTLTQIDKQFADMRLNAQLSAANAVANVFQIVGQKSKVAAVAAIAVNTAVQSAQAIQNTLAASVAAIAPPPLGLGPIAGAPLAASIKAWGALQVAAIVAAGTLNAGSALKGGSPPSGSGSGGSFGGSFGGGGFGSGDAPQQDFGRAVIIDMRAGALYGTQAVQDLIVRINEEIQNGATLISTRNIDV